MYTDKHPVWECSYLSSVMINFHKGVSSLCASCNAWNFSLENDVGFWNWVLKLQEKFIQGFLASVFIFQLRKNREDLWKALIQWQKDALPLSAFSSTNMLTTLYIAKWSWHVIWYPFHIILSTNPRVRNLAVSSAPWDISEVIRDKHGINKNIPWPDLPTIPLLAENVRFFVTFPPFRFLT